MGFAAYLVEAVCDVSLTLLFYFLLGQVSRSLSLLAVFFRLMSTATFAFAELFYFGADFILGESSHLHFSREQLNGLAFLSLRFYAQGGELFMAFYGIGLTLIGYLVVRSVYFPKTLGVLLALGGLGFIAMNFTLVLAPAYASEFLVLPATIALLLLALWFVFRGVNVASWEKTATAELTPVP